MIHEWPGLMHWVTVHAHMCVHERMIVCISGRRQKTRGSDERGKVLLPYQRLNFSCWMAFNTHPICIRPLHKRWSHHVTVLIFNSNLKIVGLVSLKIDITDRFGLNEPSIFSFNKRNWGILSHSFGYKDWDWDIIYTRRRCGLKKIYSVKRKAPARHVCSCATDLQPQ